MLPSRLASRLALIPLVLALTAGCGGDDDGDEGSSGDTPNQGEGEPQALSGITAAHNAARASVNPPAATPIPPLTWSPDIAAVAQAYAERCDFNHSSGPYGENLYASTGGSTPDDVVGSWVSEVAEYDYATNGCAGVCGHYTQVVWADSLRLGCGMASCTENSPFGGPWEIWVCNYDPPGNWIGEKPY